VLSNWGAQDSKKRMGKKTDISWLPRETWSGKAHKTQKKKDCMKGEPKRRVCPEQTWGNSRRRSVDKNKRNTIVFNKRRKIKFGEGGGGSEGAVKRTEKTLEDVVQES